LSIFFAETQHPSFHINEDHRIKFQLKNPVVYARLNQIRARVYRVVSRLDAGIVMSAEPIAFDALERSAFVPVHRAVNWGKKLSCAWFHVSGGMPAGIKHPVLLLENTGEGLVYTPNGEILDGLSSVYAFNDLPRSANPRVVFDLAGRESDAIDYYIDYGYNGFLLNDVGFGRFGGAYLAERDDDVFALYYDYLALALLMSSTGRDDKRTQIARALSAAYARFSRGDAAGARAELAPVLGKPSDSEFVFDAVGHGHLDLAWMWPIRETRRKAARTYASALGNIARYPDYVYGTSQPQQLQWMKDEHPALYARVKEAVLQGRIELQGGFWTECDVNLTGGESLVRQAIYGAQFVREEFGQEMRICWLPDAFGFNGNLPQILQGCGMEYFSTIKITWNKVNTFPYRTFFWQGIDGSRVLVHMPPEGDYNSAAGAHNILNSIKKYPERSLNTALLVYGSGDGGGGPRENHMELLRREQNLDGLPRVRFGSAIGFFDALKTKNVEHVHTGELYLETHQGTLTTQADNKRDNRLMERLLHNAEAASAAFLPADGYPTEAFEALWKEMLLYQFHDILPGTCIERVYRETAPAYVRMKAEATQITIRALPNAEALACVNLTSFVRREHVRVEGVWYAADVPPYAISQPKPSQEQTQLRYTDNTMENGQITLVFNAFGEIASCMLADGHELARGPLNRLTLYSDPLTIPFDAWDLQLTYYKKRRRRLQCQSATTRRDGPRLVREHTYRFGKSSILQRVILEAGSDCVRFETHVDWHERLKMLRADFFPADYGDTAEFDIQFGAMARPTTERDSVETAQIEVCGHKWVSVHKDGRGFAVLNDSKYGHRVKSGLLSLNLLRAPIYPNKHADRGQHDFTYAFCPTGGDNARAVEEGYRLNHPLLVGNYQPQASLAFVSNPAVVLETIKRSEDKNAVVLRLYESLGKPAETILTTQFAYDQAQYCDLLERPLGAADLAQLRFAPYQILTIRLEGGTLK
jgi:alpha-mannosidase